ncbi:gp31 protein [Mycobacteroides abscessus subsp. abscessus]|uniref:hypothetical protein n=1 Tax=Mycobacteroides abscessus TaxID=36809 RepID=UPI00092767ED|nr:hypothetical protein [Mycobacteroides abscessus]SIC56507.1 gp31 protein [Mycobacteroides abscessus subsp. abscessus]SKU57661.1 gp31 protein [Mycobacteroides abscessus subsp. abscessus]
MALPATGASYASTIQPTLQPLAAIKARVTNILVRDYHNLDGSVFNLAAPSAGLNPNGVFTPFAADGALRPDLLITSPGPNLGFYSVGHIKGDGVKGTTMYAVDETDSAQTLFPIRLDSNKDGISLTFTPREVNPVSLYLTMDMALNSNPNGVVPMGQAQLSIAAPSDAPIVERIVIAICLDGNGKRFAVTLTRCAVKKKGGFQLNRKDTVLGELEYESLLDPNTGTTYIWSEDGADWRGFGGVPAFSGALSATAQAGKLAQLLFTTPVATDLPLTYTVNQITPAALPAQVNTATIPAPSAPTVTTSGTAGTTNYFYKAVVHTANGTVASAEGTIATGNATLSSSNYNVVAFTLPAGAVSWDLYRGSTAGAENTLIASALTTGTFNDQGAAGTAGTPPVANTATLPAPTGVSATPSTTGGTFPAGQTAYYVVSAITATGETVPSAEFSAVAIGTTGSITVAWGQVPGATGYRIYRGTASGLEIALVQAVPSGSTVSYVDTGAIQATPATVTAGPTVAGANTQVTAGSLVAGSNYAFQVAATGSNNRASTSAWSNVITAVS